MATVPIPVESGFSETISCSYLGRGFKLNISDGESPFKQPVFMAGDEHMEVVPVNQEYKKSKVIQSSSQVQEVMNLKGELSVSYGPLISGEGGGKFLKDKVSSQSQVVIIYVARSTVYSMKLKKWEPVPEVVSVLHGDMNEFAEKCGTKFVDEVQYGASLQITFRYTSTNTLELQDLEANLTGSVGIGALKVSFEAHFSKTDKSESRESDLEIEAKSIGCLKGLSVSVKPELKDVEEMVNSFNAQCETRRQEFTEYWKARKSSNEKLDAMQMMDPVAFTLVSTCDKQAPMTAAQAAALDQRMREWSTIFQNALYWKEYLKMAESIVNSEYSKDPRTREQHVVPYRNAIAFPLQSLDAKINECLKYRAQTAQEILGLGSYPLKQLPSLLPGPSDENEFEGFCGRGYLPLPGGCSWSGYVVGGKCGLNGAGLAHGKGKFTWANGNVYDGEWKDDKRNGKGKLTYNGNVYDGEWKDHKKNGKGKDTLEDGDVYDGEFKDDKRNGKGKLTSTNGTVYDGEWKDDKRNGMGKLDGKYGEWKDDKALYGFSCSGGGSVTLKPCVGTSGGGRL